MFVTFEDYNGQAVDVNPAFVQSVSTYQHYDHDLAAPDEMMHLNADGLPEVNPKHREKVDALRTSERVIISLATGTVIVKGTVKEVKQALDPKSK